jgi:phage-related protein
MTTFSPPQAPDASGTSGSHQYRILKANFGDGYEQRAGDGINPKQSEYTLTWTRLSTTDAASIESFFDGLGGYESFDYTLPGEAATKKFVCEKFTKPYESGNLMGITATLRRVYDL